MPQTQNSGPRVDSPGRRDDIARESNREALGVVAMQPNRPYFRWTRVGMAALLLGVQLNGCASGVATRGITPPDAREIEELRLVGVSPGMQVRVTLRGDSVVGGKFRGLSRMGPEAYARRVAEFRAARFDPTPLPAPGSLIQVRRGSKTRAALLDGFGYRSLELRWKASSPLRSVSFDDLVAVTDSSGRVWTRDALDMEMLRGHVPCLTLIELETESGRTQVPVDQVRNVAYRTPSGHWLVGGLVIATMVVIVVAVLARQSEPTPQCQGPSPTLWSLRDPDVRSAFLGMLSDTAALAGRDGARRGVVPPGAQTLASRGGP